MRLVRLGPAGAKSRECSPTTTSSVDLSDVVEDFNEAFFGPAR